MRILLSASAAVPLPAGLSFSAFKGNETSPALLDTAINRKARTRANGAAFLANRMTNLLSSMASTKRRGRRSAVGILFADQLVSAGGWFLTSLRTEPSAGPLMVGGIPACGAPAVMTDEPGIAGGATAKSKKGKHFPPARATS